MMICNLSACTGCLACIDVCPVKAISEKKDFRGFPFPYVDNEKCVQCKKCFNVCPVNYQKKNKKSDTPLSCWDKNKGDRVLATSGGVFTLLAREVIKEGGVVYGAAFDSNFKVVHIRIDKEEDVHRLRGSKYVQSETIHIYQEIEEEIKKHKVLFSGTPCQNAALKNYIGEENENLFCIDIMCHGVPSPEVFEDYKRWLENKHGSSVKGINFRYKKPGWTVFSMKVDFDNGYRYISTKYQDPFLCFFLVKGGDLTLRESCFECRYTSPERVGDITLADFWQYKAKHYSSHGSEKGVNLVLVNSHKGRKLFDLIKNNLAVEEHTWLEAYKSNKQLSESNKKPEKYDAFWKTYTEGGYDAVLQRYWIKDKEGERKAFIVAWKRAHEFLLPRMLKR